MTSDKPFSRLMASAQSQGDCRILAQEVQFEAARVRFVVRRFGLGAPVLRQLVEDWFRTTGRRELRFAAFHERYPTFPFYFGTHTLCGLAVPWTAGAVGGRTPYNYHVHRDPYSTEPARYKKFEWVPFVIAYRQFYNSASAAASGRSIGLIFPRRGMVDGMIIHNDESEQFWTSGLCQVYKDPKTEKRLYVQPFAALIAAIYNNGRGWRP